jgi:tetratricopeptide (TPR) repeat protein
LKIVSHIFILLAIGLIASCTGSRKYFKAAERLEKQGLMDEAAGYYLEALQRKPSNVDAKIKLKEVGQKYVSSLSSRFFREYNTQQLESSLETFEKLRDFNKKTNALNVQLDYPKTYDEDYQKAVEQYCLKNYNQANMLVSQKKYYDAQPFISKIEKYNTSYKNVRQLDIIATCEPLYQSAINNLENKNYAGALNLLSNIKVKTDNYKDSRDLLELASAQHSKSFILFEPKPAFDADEKRIEEYLYDSFTQAAVQKLGSVQIINNSPFQNAPSTTDLNNSTNVDLIQAIRKATGADYFYVFDISNKRESNTGLNKTPMRGFEETVTKKNDTLTITEYKPFDYSLVKSQRTYSYDFKYKLINAYSNQIVSTQTHNVKATDAIEYQEFARRFNGNINSLYPYNPQQTAPLMRYNPKNWRNSFSARNTLKPFEDLKNEALSQTVNLFTSSASGMK